VPLTGVTSAINRRRASSTESAWVVCSLPQLSAGEMGIGCMI
jgi:hypothetical protein